MKFFSGSKKQPTQSQSPSETRTSTPSSKKHTSNSSADDRTPSLLQPQQKHSRSEPVSPTKAHASTSTSSPSGSRSPKKSSRSATHRDAKDVEKPSSPRHARLSRHSTEPLPPSSSSSSSRRGHGKSGKLDVDTHPLNLPPEERRRLSKLSNHAMNDHMDQMDIDREPVNGVSSPATGPQNPASAQANFSVPITNGNGVHADKDDEAPEPPPHGSNPSSPPPNLQEEADAFKAAGNKFFKDKEYSKAIAEYSKGNE